MPLLIWQLWRTRPAVQDKPRLCQKHWPRFSSGRAGQRLANFSPRWARRPGRSNLAESLPAGQPIWPSVRCSDCHNVGSFCAKCHAAAGLVSSGPLGAGYHDASPFFTAGHGQAARQSLETCTGCHVERDCLRCHSAVGGRRFNPHGPGFDAARMRRKNPEMCTACHGAAIPGT